jgi:ABC-type nitrate/sulfonate/bicarbonate transport system substrate-binding protein
LLLEKDRNFADRVFIPDPAKHVEMLLSAGDSQPTVAVTPFANALIAMSRNPNLVIIGGSGLNGLSLLSSAGRSLDDLAGKKIGTARGDSLEVFAYEAMKPRKYEFVYFTDPNVLVDAAKHRQIDAATHVEPFATDLVENAGMFRVLRSKDLWGDHPDAVLLTTRNIAARYGPALRELLARLTKMEAEIKADPIKAADTLAPFYNMGPGQLRGILGFQEPRIDIRIFESFLKRV